MNPEIRRIVSVSPILISETIRCLFLLVIYVETAQLVYESVLVTNFMKEINKNLHLFIYNLFLEQNGGKTINLWIMTKMIFIYNYLINNMKVLTGSFWGSYILVHLLDTQTTEYTLYFWRSPKLLDWFDSTY